MIRVFFFPWLIEDDAMNSIMDILEAISIGMVVANFLLNTGRGLKAIEVCTECPILLNNVHLLLEEEVIFIFF